MVSNTRKLFVALVAVGLVVPATFAELITFDVGDGGMVLQNGMPVDSPGAFGDVFTIGSTGDNLGSVVFDSNPVGPNADAADQDLLIDMTNILILQDRDQPGQNGGLVTSPNDSFEGGSIMFDFSVAGFDIEVQSIDVIDIDEGSAMTLTLTDAFGRSREVGVPSGFTGDIRDGDVGTALIDLLGGPQVSPIDGGLLTTVGQEAGFDSTNIVSLLVDLSGSSALDNLRFVPEPTTALLLCGGLVALMRRRR